MYDTFTTPTISESSSPHELVSKPKTPGSNEQPPRAIIVWSRGLSGSPVILPVTDTFEEGEQVRKLLEGALGNQG